LAGDVKSFLGNTEVRYSSSNGSTIPKITKFGYTDFKVLSDAEPT
jgi:hypothetical protein